MTNDAPDWMRQVLVNVVVESEPVTPTVANEALKIDINRLTTSSTSYGTVATWTVSTDKIGELWFIEMMSDDYDHTQFKLVVGSTTIFEDLDLDTSLTLDCCRTKLEAGTVVTLSAKSTDGTEVNVDGDIIATYKRSFDVTNSADIVVLNDITLQGIKRLGLWQIDEITDTNHTSEFRYNKFIGQKQYELTNHLGNVLATVSDYKNGIDSNNDGTVNYYNPDIHFATDYYPFGMGMPERQYLRQPCN